MIKKINKYNLVCMYVKVITSQSFPCFPMMLWTNDSCTMHCKYFQLIYTKYPLMHYLNYLEEEWCRVKSTYPKSSKPLHNILSTITIVKSRMHKSNTVYWYQRWNLVLRLNLQSTDADVIVVREFARPPMSVCLYGLPGFSHLQKTYNINCVGVN